MSKDWTNLYKKHKGPWVALAKDEITVLGSGKTVKEALVTAKKNSSETPILTRMPKTLANYVGIV